MQREELRHRFVLRLLDAVLDRGTGRNQTVTEFYKPSESFFIGNLGPVPDEDDIARVSNKLFPTSIGLEFQVPPQFDENAKVIVEPSGAFYYRVYPTYQQQLEFLNRQEHESPTRGEVRLAPIYKKLKLENVKLEIPLAKLVENETGSNELIWDLTDECRKLWKLGASDPRFFRILIVRRVRRRSKVEVLPASAMASEDAFEECLAKADKAEMQPKWSLIISRKVFRTKDGRRIIISLENNTEKENDYSKENSFFESKLKISLTNAVFQPFDLEYLNESYEYNRTILAAGINCSCTVASETQIETEHVPRFTEHRFDPVELPDLTFTRLVNDPAPVLTEVERTLEQSKGEFIAQYQGRALGPSAKTSFEHDLDSIKQEVERFMRGVNVLNAYPDAMRAFKLTNEAFRLASRYDTARYDTWRLFQIVFIVSLIPDVVSVVHPEVENHRDSVDLLFYPTGGGKTEAFLGLAVFQAFFDRMHGKRAGVSTLAKFPLRMLSLQQLQRIADIFAMAELVRRKQPDLSRKEYDPFTVGYYVGENNTPNRLVDYDENQRKYVTASLEAWQRDPEQAQRFLVVSRCPFCGNDKVKVKADPKNVRLYHWCDNPDCESTGPLPVFVTDTEIYRYLPTLIVSTLDKLVACGFQRNFRNILGGAFIKCPAHGYSSSWKCTERICIIPEKDLALVNLADPSPGLLIQDELHLVREGLGCFASHYETFFNYAVSALSGDAKKKVKIIGATATASNYQEQTRHLYQREAIRFPTNIKLYLRESDRSSRIIIGIMPHAKTTINSMEEIVFAISREHQLLLRKTIEELSVALNAERIDREMFRDVSQDFQTQVAYHVKKIDAEQLTRSVWSRINRSLEREGLDTILSRNLTGDVTFHRVRKIMNEIENPAAGQAVGLVTATSLISHGIDIDKLNLMVFMGMPSNNAEYIQALSRVARREEGLVIVLFNPIRERDQSYYRYFLKFHELSHLLIEGVPINRWAPSALERTSSGIFTGALYSYFDLQTTRNSKKEISKVGTFKKALNEHTITEDEIKNFVKGSYGVDLLAPPQKELIEHLLDERVSSYVGSILNFEGDQNTMLFLVVDRENGGPLKSLRSVDSGVAISLDAPTLHILRNFRINADISEG
jgi:hypothetical protein